MTGKGEKIMNIAFIPVRGGSSSITLKNIKPICGKPLVYWAVKAACECRDIDFVYVATDSDVIRKTVEGFRTAESGGIWDKIRVIGRSAESATDTASTETAMLEFAENYEFDSIALVQATSPMLKAADIEGGFTLFRSPETDSVLSVVRQRRFVWKKEESGRAVPANYDIFRRPRRQEFEGFLMENGAFYITSRNNLLQHKNRISGNIKTYEMAEDSAFEMDEPGDWIIIEALMKKNGLAEGGKEAVPQVKMFLTDCDGCLTDGGMYYSEQGDELKKFNTKDGMGLSFLREKGILTGIVTGENVELNRRRAEKLKLDIYKPGCKDKAAIITELCRQYRIDPENVVYVGDDVNDLEVIRMVGFGCCPADAVPVVKAAAKYISAAKGGEGVIREVIDKILPYI